MSKQNRDRIQFTISQMVVLTTMVAVSVASAMQSVALAYCLALIWASTLISVLYSGYYGNPIQHSLLLSMLMQELVLIGFALYFGTGRFDVSQDPLSFSVMLLFVSVLMLPISAAIALAGVYLGVMLRLLF